MLQAKPTDICQSETVSFQQPWQYRTTWPVSEILHDQFFLPLRAYFASGDTIRIIRYDQAPQGRHVGLNVLEIADVVVTKCDREALSVPLAVINRWESPTSEQVQLEQPTIVASDKGKHRIMQGEKFVAEFGSRSEAKAALSDMVSA